MPYSTTVTFNDMVSTTLENRSAELTQQIFKDTPVLGKLMNTDAFRPNSSGGTYITGQVEYAKNETVTSFGRGATLTIADQNILTAYQYTWKYVVGHIVSMYTDKAENKGAQQLIDLATTKLNNLINSLKTKYEAYMFSDGTGNGGLDPMGLPGIVATSNTTGTVGGLSRADNDWWRNQSLDFSNYSIYTQMRKYLRKMCNDCSQGQGIGMPNMLITHQSVHEALADELTDNFTAINGKVEDVTTNTIYFAGLPIQWSPYCDMSSSSAYKMYVLNTSFLNFVYDPAEWFKQLEWRPSSSNQLDEVKYVVCRGNLITTRLSSHGVIYNISL